MQGVLVANRRQTEWDSSQLIGNKCYCKLWNAFLSKYACWLKTLHSIPVARCTMKLGWPGQQLFSNSMTSYFTRYPSTSIAKWFASQNLWIQCAWTNKHLTDRSTVCESYSFQKRLTYCSQKMLASIEEECLLRNKLLCCLGRDDQLMLLSEMELFFNCRANGERDLSHLISGNSKSQTKRFSEWPSVFEWMSNAAGPAKNGDSVPERGQHALWGWGRWKNPNQDC